MQIKKSIDAWVAKEGYHVKRYLKQLLDGYQKDMVEEPDLFIDEDCDSPYIDVRLVIDTDGSWTVNTGSSDYDQWHGVMCAANTITPTISIDDLYNELIDELYY